MTTAAAAPVRVETRDGIALVLIDNPPVNASSQAVRAGLLAGIRSAQADPAVGAVVIACEGRTFVAGGDIREFGKPPLEPSLPDVCNLIEASSKPVVAALHGTALGGGLEIALACHARVLAADARVGLPEVKLGLIPGAGGTQRLPRLVGVLAALDIITSGRQVKADEALGLGLADRVATGDLRSEAAEVARGLVGKPLRRTGALAVPAFDATEFDAAIKAATRKARGQVSPGKAAEMVALAATLPIEQGLARERALFFELMAGSQSRALRHAFFAEREVLRVPSLEGVAPRALASAGVIGAGTRGVGIAVALSDAGLPVTIVETNSKAIEGAKGRLQATYDRMLKSGRVSAAEHAARLARITVSDRFEALAAPDLVIEAVFEEMDIKQEVFRRLGATAKAGAVLATNTSYLDIDPIAAAGGRAGDVIGLHFFAPANIMRLVEIVRGAESDPTALATGLALAKRLGKIPVVCGICDGFVGNRILTAYRQQAEFALEDGALPHEVDAAFEALGFPMGPLAVADLSGLDISWARRKRLAATRDPRVRYASRVADRLCELGRFGQKTSAGWYRYEDGKRVNDPAVAKLIEAVSAELGIARTPISAETMQRRFRAAMVNEGAKILDEGIAARALDIDMVMIHGYGYPAWRGGPMFEADEIGLPTILADVEEMSAASGTGWEPAPLLIKLAEAGGRFGDWKAPAR
ncbi:MAG: enoyl-CoA hydratase/isomerase family protein [Hyphomicrobiales bacterium]|nr:enoyl-CoA hydratase/isomerase family protein [Hyphomicrobiales bacterium]